MNHTKTLSRNLRAINLIALFWLSIFFSTISSAQNSQSTDSLKRKLAITKIDSLKADILDDIALEYSNSNLDSAKYFSGKSYEIAKKLNHPRLLYNSLSSLGLFNRKTGDYPLALQYHQEALKIALSNHFTVFHIYKSYNHLCLDYTEQGNFNAAIEFGHKAMLLVEKTNDTLTMALTNNNLADVFFHTQKYDKAIMHYKKALGYAIKLNNLFGQGLLYGNIGSVFYQTEQLDSALVYYQKSLAVSKSIEDVIGEGVNYLNIGSYYQKVKNNQKALDYFNQAEKIFLSQEMEPDLSTIYYNIATSYLEMKDYNKSKLYAEKALVLANKLESYPLKESAHLALKNVCEKLGNTADAYYHFQQYINARDSIYNEENRNAQYKSEIEFDYVRKRDTDSLQHVLDIQLEKEKTYAQQKYTYTAAIGCIILLALSLLIFKNYKEKQKANVIISSQKKEVEMQKSIIEEHQKETIDSINYAKKIQYTLLAHEDVLKENLKEHFVFFKPKDIVSGDFYWATSVKTSAAEGNKNLFYLAVCDSTGHGVPGAFMSLLNMGFLNEAIKEKNILQPNDILNYVRKRLIESIGNDGQQDGMDAILVCIDKNTQTITYSAANNEPILISTNHLVNELVELPKDKMPVGRGEKKEDFNLHTIDCKIGDYIYLYTDGFADQFGGPNGKKFKYKQLNNLLLNNCNKDLTIQKEILQSSLNNWKKDLEQVDDILIIGIKV